MGMPSPLALLQCSLQIKKACQQGNGADVFISAVPKGAQGRTLCIITAAKETTIQGGICWHPAKVSLPNIIYYCAISLHEKDVSHAATLSNTVQSFRATVLTGIKMKQGQ